ncbi:MAG: isochorismate synthase [Bacteroidia bacterium]
MEYIDLIKWLGSGKSFFCLKKPTDTHISIYGLSPENKPVSNAPSVLVCPFASKQPNYYPIENEWKITVAQFAELEIDLKSDVKSTSNIMVDSVEYQNYVTKALESISANKFDKVVLAQSQWFSKVNIDLQSVFIKACNTPNSYSYLLRLDGTHWIGASPELFLKSDYKTCESVALAGTRLHSKITTTWGDKEVQEQSVVGSFLLNAFNELGFKNIEIGPRFTKLFGNIEHICNPIQATLPPDVDWQTVFSKFHPTPALAGFPKSDAIEFITQTESFSRKLYGGFIGTMEAQRLELFVNIRSAEIYKDGAQLYAGAGINHDSIPKDEWEETLTKLRVMQSILD